MTVDPLAKLRDQFRKKAKEEALAIRLAWAKGAEGLQDVEHLAHGLAGAAGIFGFVEIGAAALAVDGRFAAGEVPREEEVDALVSAIDGI
ncbi:Hpt domain-containing protein [Brevundimonas intermedia]|uniref:Hpt domain-containing protein n=1 Tax=Brevundimonas intermedia TaxID=74315 RepID=A0A4Y9S0I3_9CAUL|nr:Hpt domain-containing protein [Brevundimonas intermedia]TFW13991.1 Hpt domain-containing protein [Brevundimonas intermedia]